MKKYFILPVLQLQPIRILYIIVALLSFQTIIAQSVGIGTTSPNPSARLEVKSSTQGILIPTLTSAQRNAISNPAPGLLVFQTNGTPGFYYYTGTNWVSLANGHQPNSQGIAVSTNYGLTTTLAGSGSQGNANGTGTAASFNYPEGIAVDASGNVYVVDNFGNRIRKITATGVVSTFAGSGLEGAVNATGTAASFKHPVGVAVDAAGNVYVGDAGNNMIRKITPEGVVSTLAGNETAGDVDGDIAIATFSSPHGVAVDASGNVYVADRFNNKIRKITVATGVVSTLAGDGLPNSDDGAGNIASFTHPTGVAVDAAGNIYVADYLNHKIRKITAAGVVTTLAGSTSSGDTDGTGTAASFFFPSGVTADAWGNVYVADRQNNKIRKITASGVVTTLAGSISSGSADGIGTSASFLAPTAVAVDASGHVYVADNGNHKIRKIITQ